MRCGGGWRLTADGGGAWAWELWRAVVGYWLNRERTAFRDGGGRENFFEKFRNISVFTRKFTNSGHSWTKFCVIIESSRGLCRGGHRERSRQRGKLYSDVVKMVITSGSMSDVRRRRHTASFGASDRRIADNQPHERNACSSHAVATTRDIFTSFLVKESDTSRCP